MNTTNDFYYMKSGMLSDEMIGPASSETLHRMYRSRCIPPQTLVCSASRTGGQWMHACLVHWQPEQDALDRRNREEAERRRQEAARIERERQEQAAQYAAWVRAEEERMEAERRSFAERARQTQEEAIYAQPYTGPELPSVDPRATPQYYTDSHHPRSGPYAPPLVATRVRDASKLPAVCGILGAAMMAAGVFAPFVQVAIISVPFTTLDQGLDAIVFLALAVIGGIMSLGRQASKLTWIPAGLAGLQLVATVAYMTYNSNRLLREAASSGNEFATAIGVAMQPSISWGAAIMLFGVLALGIASFVENLVPRQ